MVGLLPFNASICLSNSSIKGGARCGKSSAELTTLQQFGQSLLDTEQVSEDQSVEEQSEGVFKGCRTAIEIMTRQPSKGTLWGLHLSLSAF